MKILAIETSCDETAVAVLECSGGLSKPHFKILGNSLVSQIDIHKEFGGVVPSLAKREHQKNLPIVTALALKEAGMDMDNPDIDLIAVTNGPGLEPALWTGITYAEELKDKWQKPLMPINHMEGHILSVLIRDSENPNNQGLITNEIRFPALALLVSGGHTEIVEVNNFGEYKKIGQTRDDAVGEAFDKVARILGLSYPGGPEVARLAAEDRKVNPEARFTFPMPMLGSGDLDFSYSGLKTAVLYKVKELGTLTDADVKSLARSFEDAAIGVLVEKMRQALDEQLVSTLIVGGGVSANTYLRTRLTSLVEEYPEVTLLFPDRSLTTDNAVMIGIAAYIESHRDKPADGPIKASGNLSF